jgi:hypothetical protein
MPSQIPRRFRLRQDPERFVKTARIAFHPALSFSELLFS